MLGPKNESRPGGGRDGFRVTREQSSGDWQGRHFGCDKLIVASAACLTGAARQKFRRTAHAIVVG
jgi:hypothetical protein